MKVDIGGSLAIASKGLFATGVSTDINISYISGVKQGEKIQVEARVDKLGKTLAFTTVELFSNGRLGKLIFRNITSFSNLFKQLRIIVALGRHNKFVAQAYNHPENILKK